MATALLDQMTALADPVRCRIASILAGHELSVSELQTVVQLPQSTVSRHLRVLAEEGLVEVRSEGTSHLYHAPVDRFPPDTASLWQVVQTAVGESPLRRGDADRVSMVLAERHRRSREFFETQAGQWDRLREELFGPRLEMLALAGLLDSEWAVGDLGCGTGHFAALVAPHVAKVIAVDESEAMLSAARARTTGLATVELRSGHLESLPIPDGALDLGVLSLVLPYAVEPSAVIAEAARVLVPGGRLIVLDLAPHDRVEYRQTMGHLWQGFSETDVRGWMATAGLHRIGWSALPPIPSALGPGLMLATGIRIAPPACGISDQ